MNQMEELLIRGVDTIYPNIKALEKRIENGKPLRVYIGVDPTGTKLHIGHSIGLSKLQEFADAGHEAILLFGTGTVLVGDPSQRSEARKRITEDEINENIKTWKEQVSKIIDFEKVKVVQNSDWLLKLTLKDIIDIASNITAVHLFKRESFQRRIDKGDTVWFHETMYPLLQGYDSVAMDVDLEIGGTDQTFNMLMGRELMQKMKGKEKFVLTTPMILGTDGQQMSKSTGNCIWLDDSPEDMYGKIMSIPDAQIDSYAELLTNLSIEELKREEPVNQKKKLARAIVSKFHGVEKANLAQEHFEKTVQKGQVPDTIPTIQLPKAYSSMVRIIELLETAKLVSSKSEAKRLTQQGGVEVDGKKITDPNESIEVKNDMIIRAGKRKYIKIKIT